MHLNIFGIETDLTPLGYTHGAYAPNTMNVSEAINWTKENGGYVIINHYYKNASAPYTYEQLRDWGADGFEVANGGNWNSKYAEILQFCKDNSLIAISTTDQHVNSELTGFTKVKLNDPNNKTVEHIFESMNTTPPECVIIPAFRYDADKDNPFWLLQAFTGYVTNLDALQVLSWVSWSVGIFFFIYYLNRRSKNVTLEKLNKKVVKEVEKGKI